MKHWNAFLSLGAALFALCGCKKEPPSVALPQPQVQVIEVKPQDVPITMEWIGTLQGYVSANIRAQVEGTLMKTDYEEGGQVKKGDVLFELDKRTYEAVLADAKGTLGKAEAVQLAAQKDEERLGPLLKTRAVSQQDYDNAVQSNLASKASVDSAKAALQKAELNVEFTKVTSPLDGIAGLAQAQVGDLITPTSQLTVVATVDPIKAYFTLSEQEYLKYREENPNKGSAKTLSFELVLANGEKYPEKGEFHAADVAINQDTGAMRLCVVFPNPGNILRPGQYGLIRAVMHTVKDAIVVPQRAVAEFQGIHEIAVVTPDNKASIRTVKTGPKIGNGWLIEEGLKPGDKVIVEGFLKVRDGLPVTASPYQPPPGTPPVTETKPAAK
jgi:membrane fusion protein (multidrug efflux system)